MQYRAKLPKKGIQGIFCVGLLMDMTAFPKPNFEVGPFSERIFQANFRFGVEISNIQLLGCVKAEKLSFLEG